MPSFTNTLICVGLICDANCTVVFKKKDITVLLPEGKTIIRGWIEKKLPRLWRFSLKPNDKSIKDYTTTNRKIPADHSAYNLPIIEPLVRYMHAAAGLPVKYTWLKAIKKGNFKTWPVLTYTNADKYCPHTVETINGHIVQSSQGVRPTKKTKHQSRVNKMVPDQITLEKQSEEEYIPPPHKTKELHIWDQPSSKLYTDDCERLLIRSRSVNEYIMIAYHCDSNTLLQDPFVNRKDKHRIRAYTSIMQRSADRGHHVDVQILDNEFSTDFKKTIVEDWCATYQLVPPNLHRRNVAERAIRTFKAYFLAVLAGLYPNFPKFMWDNLLIQTELNINLLRQATLNPSMSTWEYFNRAFDYTATPLGPIGCKIIIHTTSNKRKSWDQRGREGFSVGPALQHYRCIQAIDSKTKSLIITDTAEYLHEYLTQPHMTAEDRMTHAINFLSTELKYVPTSIWNSQLAAIEAIQKIFANW